MNMRICLAAAAIFLTTSFAHADIGAEMATCRAETDSLRRLTCYDQIQAGTTPVLPAIGKSAALIVLTKADLRLQDKDFQKEVFNRRIELRPTFKNNSSKTVVAIEHTLAVTDAFGEKIVNETSKLDIRMPPGETVASDTFYFFNDNPFINGEAFDKLQGPVSTGVAKPVLIVTKAVFSDGSVEAY